jgi:hypothetical protein
MAGTKELFFSGRAPTTPAQPARLLWDESLVLRPAKRLQQAEVWAAGKLYLLQDDGHIMGLPVRLRRATSGRPPVHDSGNLPPLSKIISPLAIIQQANAQLCTHSYCSYYTSQPLVASCRVALEREVGLGQPLDLHLFSSIHRFSSIIIDNRIDGDRYRIYIDVLR